MGRVEFSGSPTARRVLKSGRVLRSSKTSGGKEPSRLSEKEDGGREDEGPLRIEKEETTGPEGELVRETRQSQLN